MIIRVIVVLNMIVVDSTGVSTICAVVSYLQSQSDLYHILNDCHLMLL